MKIFLITLLAVGAIARPDVSHLKQNGDQDAQIRSQASDLNPDGSYTWNFETSNGISQQAQGQIQNANSENAFLSAQGQSQHQSPEGETIQLSYVADENGYQPQGSHLPTPPPIPEAILRSLEYIRANPPAPERN